MSDEINLNDLGPLPEPPRKKGRRRRIVTEEERAKKTSPEWKEHLRKIGIQKGATKHPDSGRKATPKETKEWLAGKSRDVAEFMYEVMNDDAQPIKERIRAAQWLGEMSMSKAPSEQKVEVNHTYDVNAMLLEAQRMASAKLIDITPKPLSIEGDTDA